MDKAAVRALGDIMISACNVGDWANILTLFSPDAKIELPLALDHLGVTRHEDLVSGLAEAFNTRFTEWTCLAEDDRLVIWGIATSTYLRTLPGLPEARGQTVEVPIAIYCRVAGGRIGRMKIIVSETDWLRMVG